MTAAPVLTRADVDALYQLPLLELVFRAAAVHQQHFKLGEVQLSQLLSIKTGGCAENCGYCSQSAHFDTGLEASKLMALGEVVTAAKAAKAGGADRFCMGAAWRELKDRDLPQIEAMVRAVKDLGLETCVTLGMLNAGQAERLKAAGLDYYNHNLDSSPEYYGEVVTTRVYQDRLDTLEAVRQAGVSVCCGGILGLGEDVSDRVGLLHALATLPEAPQSVPINALVPIPGTPLGDRVLAEGGLDPFELVRAVATARILMPRSVVRLSAGRESLSEALQALCFLAGANSIFIGARLLTTPNPEPGTDAALFRRLGLTPLQTQTPAPENAEVEDKVFEYLR